MSGAELGCELGDAGGPLLVAAATPAHRYGTPALLPACGPAVTVAVGVRRRAVAGRC
ncbi:hypothetical protein ACWD3I_16540 [Streptomyces sp. NPDC002817]